METLLPCTEIGYSAKVLGGAKSLKDSCTCAFALYFSMYAVVS